MRNAQVPIYRGWPKSLVQATFFRSHNSSPTCIFLREIKVAYHEHLGHLLNIGNVLIFKYIHGPHSVEFYANSRYVVVQISVDAQARDGISQSDSMLRNQIAHNQAL